MRPSPSREAVRTILPLSIALLVVPFATGPGCPGTNDQGGSTTTSAPQTGPIITTSGYGCQSGTSDLYAGKIVAWGDLHSHTSYSQDAVEKNACAVTPEQACYYALNTSRLDFVAITDHAEDGAPGGCTTTQWKEMMRQIKAVQDKIDAQSGTGRPVFDPNSPTDTGTTTDPTTPSTIVTRPMVIFPGFEYTKSGSAYTWQNGQWVYVGLPAGNGHKDIICYDFSTTPPRGVGYTELKEDIVDDSGTVVLAKGAELSVPTQLWTYLNSVHSKYICIPHHPAKQEDKDNSRVDVRTDWGGKVSGTNNYDEQWIYDGFQPLVEIYSRHGTSEMAMDAGADDQIEQVNAFEASCSVEGALSKWLASPTHNGGYKLGIVGGTDTHDGNPGAVEETLDNTDERLGTAQGGMWTGGLTAVWVASVERSEVWNNLRGRNCFATSGSRIAVEFTAKLGEDLVPMGGTLTHCDTFSAEQYAEVNLHIAATGSNGGAITRLQVFRNGTCIADIANTASGTFHVDFPDQLDADYAYYRVKVWQQKANNPLADYRNVAFERAWSSPIWVEKLPS